MSPVMGSNTSAVRPDVPLTSRPPIKCPIVRMRSSQDLRGCRFWRHLAVFVAFGKGFHAQRVCENATLPDFQDIRPMSYGITGWPCQSRAVVEAFLAEDFFVARFGGAARPSTASRPAP